jgi:hypothetical protein
VSGSDVLMAVWDGQPARGKGGTAEVVEYARALGKPLILINPATLEIQRENWDKLESTDSSLTHLNHLPAASAGWGENPFKAPDSIFNFQQKCDHAASQGAPQFRRLIVGTVLLHVLATLIASGALAFGLHLGVLIWLKLLCLAGALAVALVLRAHHHSQHSWVRCRLAAEFCRSAAERPVSMGEFRDIYLSKRIDDQLAYYKKREARALPLFLRLKVGFWIATLCALACTLVYAVSHTAHWEVPEWTRMTGFYFLPIALPVVAAALISLISINDLQRRVARYREMQLMLEQSRKQVAYCRTWNSLERIVMKTERSLLQEVLEWHSLTSFAESH